MLGWVEIVIRSFVALLIFIGISRMFVKKPIGETSQMEFGFIATVVIILSVGSFQLSIPVPYLLLALIIWGGGALGISLISMKSVAVRTLIYGKGTPLMKDGKILEDNMKKQQVTTDELLRKLRAKQIFQMADVEFAVLEANGELNVLVKKELQPITAKVLGHQVAPIKEPQTVMMDGKVLDEPLSTRGLNRQWLEGELAKMDVLIENVFLAQVDEYGQLTIDLFDDLIQTQEPTELPLLNANVKKVQADLQLYALSTENKQARRTYQWSSDQMKHVYELISHHTK